MAKRDNPEEGYDNLAHGVADHGMTAEEQSKARKKEQAQTIKESAKEAKQAEKANDSESTKEASS